MSNEVLCAECGHPVRRHTSLGCQSNGGACECALTPERTKCGNEPPKRGPGRPRTARPMEVNFQWEDPPAPGQAPTVNQEYLEIAAKLRERPGQWARVFDAAQSGFHSAINSGRLIAFRPKGAFQARSKRNPDGKTRMVWVRYVGTGPES